MTSFLKALSTSFSPRSKYDLHVSCETLSIYAFDKIIKTGNQAYLIKGYQGQEVEPTEEMDIAWKNIYDEYSRLSDNREAIDYYELRLEVNYLETRIKVASQILNVISTQHMTKDVLKEYVKVLGHWGFILNLGKDFMTEIERLSRQLKSAGTKYRIKLKELEAMSSGEAPSSLTRQAIRLKKNFGLIDTRETTVVQWIEINKENAEIIKATKAA